MRKFLILAVLMWMVGNSGYNMAYAAVPILFDSCSQFSCDCPVFSSSGYCCPETVYDQCPDGWTYVARNEDCERSGDTTLDFATHAYWTQTYGTCAPTGRTCLKYTATDTCGNNTMCQLTTPNF